MTLELHDPLWRKHRCNLGILIWLMLLSVPAPAAEGPADSLRPIGAAAPQNSSAVESQSALRQVWVWSSPSSRRGTTTTMTAELEFNGNLITGTLSSSSNRSAGQGRIIEKGMLKNDEISFEVKNGGFVFRHRGNISGNRIRGTIELVSAGVVQRTARWDALRQEPEVERNAASETATVVTNSPATPPPITVDDKDLRKAALEGNSKAQVALGERLETTGGETNLVEAAVWYRKAADQGSPEGQYDFGRSCFLGFGGKEKDRAEAFKWITKAAQQGLPIAENMLALCYRDGLGVAVDTKSAREWFEKSANHGYAWAQNNLGICYSQGVGGPTDQSQAFRWFSLAAAQGLLEGMNNLAIQIDNGLGTPVDHGRAVLLMKRAAEGGVADAQANLALAYSEGRGVKKDGNEAIRWYLQAAKQEEGVAARMGEYGLGIIYRDGSVGVPVQLSRAASWFLKASEKGFARAQYLLALLYLEGRGVQKDNVEALKWLLIADAQGHERSHNRIPTVTIDMTPEQIEESKRRASAFKPPKTAVNVALVEIPTPLIYAPPRGFLFNSSAQGDDFYERQRQMREQERQEEDRRWQEQLRRGQWQQQQERQRRSY